MMKLENIKNPDDIERYIEGCLTDFETAICTKEDTLICITALVAYVYKKAKQEKNELH